MRRLTKYHLRQVARMPRQLIAHHLGRRKTFSLVCAVYNVAPYLETFLQSVVDQDYDLKDVELIVIDDGSTDGSGDIADTWAARFPDFITAIHQENQGISGARNTGLRRAEGRWIGFPDPDDFLDRDYLRQLKTEIDRHHGCVIAVCARHVAYREDAEIFRDENLSALGRRDIARVVRLTPDVHFIYLNVNSAVLSLDAIRRHGLEFDPRVVPTFEDGHFTNRLFMREAGNRVAFWPQAHYYYRKRAAADSLVDTARAKKSAYLDRMRFGHLALAEEAQSLLGHVPRHVQISNLNDLITGCKALTARPAGDPLLTGDEVDAYFDIVERLMKFVTIDTIENYGLGNGSEEQKVGLLGLFKATMRSAPKISVEQIDAKDHWLRLVWYTGTDGDAPLVARIDGQEVALSHHVRVQTSLLGRPYYRTHSAWLQLPPGRILRCTIAGHVATLRRDRQRIGTAVDFATIAKAARHHGRPGHYRPEDLDYRRFLLRDDIRETYRDAWVLIDRIDRAGDNAEHLYRHLLATGQAERAYFVLSRASPDWSRLEAEGFALLAYGMPDHIAAHCHAARLISSRAAPDVLSPAPHQVIGDLPQSKFVYLRDRFGGDDDPAALNLLRIDLCAATTPADYEHLTAPDGRYLLSDREVMPAGEPRQDALLAAAAREAATHTPPALLVLPGWPASLRHPSTIAGEIPHKIKGFRDTAYAKLWTALLHDPRLFDLATTHGLEIVLAPHPDMEVYLDEMDLPDTVQIAHETAHPGGSGGYPALLARAAVALAGHAAPARDVAFLGRPLVHLDVDTPADKAGATPAQSDPDHDLFGPLTRDVDAAIAALTAALTGAEDPAWARHRATVFAQRDGQACARITAAILRGHA